MIKEELIEGLQQIFNELDKLSVPSLREVQSVFDSMTLDERILANKLMKDFSGLIGCLAAASYHWSLN